MRVLEGQTKCSQVKEAVREIARLAEPGDRLPSLNELIDQFSVSKVTVRQAYAELETEGIIQRERGRGTFVAEARPEACKEISVIAVVNMGNPQEYLHKPNFIMNLYWAGLIEAAEQADALLKCHDHRDNELVLRRLQAGEYHGALVAVPLDEVPDLAAHFDFLRRLAELGVPHVALNIDTDFPVLQQLPLNVIHAAEAHGMMQLVDHYVSLGHRRLAYIGQVLNPTHHQRLRGVQDALLWHGLSFDQRCLGCITRWEEIEGVVAQLMAQPEPPSGILFANDFFAFHGHMALRELGYRVPHDVSISGFDDMPHASRVDPPISTVRKPRERMARRAIQLLPLLRTGRIQTPVQELFPVEMVIRETIVAPKHQENS